MRLLPGILFAKSRKYYQLSYVHRVHSQWMHCIILKLRKKNGFRRLSEGFYFKNNEMMTSLFYLYYLFYIFVLALNNNDEMNVFHSLI